jgi:Restriction endonuclease
MSCLTPHLLDLIQHAVLTSFWTKKAFKRFLMHSGVPEVHIVTMGDETKREYLERLWVWLQKQTFGESVLTRIAENLKDQTSYPDLLNWEDSARKVSTAQQAVEDLREYLLRQERATKESKAADAVRRQRADLSAKNAVARKSFDALKSRFKEIGTRLGSQRAGYDFEQWFFDLIEFFEVSSRRPYKQNGRQIDGSITMGDTTYLIELKFTAGPCDAPEVDTFLRKVTTKADNTMGIMVSMSGYTDPAKQEASGPRTPLLLMDYSHVLKLLSEELSMKELIQRIRSHASQTGVAFLATKDFG